jgi:hypothetical protein
MRVHVHASYQGVSGLKNALHAQVYAKMNLDMWNRLSRLAGDKAREGASPRALLIGGSYSSGQACDLPVSCPGVSRLANRGLSLHDLVL